MRGLRSTILLVVALVGVGGYAYYLKDKPQDSGTGQEKVFPGATAADKIDEITVKSEGGDTTTLKRESTGWKIVAPLATAAAESEASGIASALSGLEIVRVIDPSPASLTDFGLDKPRIDVQFKGPNGVAGHLVVGGKTPTGASLYARRNDEKAVFLIAAYQDTALNRSTFDLRDKTLVTIPRAKVQTIEIVNGDTSVVLTKKDKEWRVTTPLDARADYSSSEAILGRVESAQMKSIAAENVTPADLSKYQLDKPSARVVMTFEGSKTELAFGAPSGEAEVYARDVSKNTVVTVEKSLADDFKKPVDDYRRRDLFDFRAFNATRAEITWNGKSLVIERTPQTDKDKPDAWKRVSPEPKELDKAKVETLLTGLADIRATAFKPATAGTGLDAPAMTVHVKYDLGRLDERASFGKSGADVYASRPDDAGALVIEAEKFTEAIATLEELIK